MFENFGARQKRSEDGALKPTAEFRVFFPGLGRGKYQCSWGGDPEIRSLAVVGSFPTCQWDFSKAVPMAATSHQGGRLYAAEIGPLAPEFYTYKYLVTFADGTQRLVADPCARFTAGGHEDDCGFVIDDPHRYVKPTVNPLKEKRLPASDLVIYELMIDDFTAEYRGARAPVAAIDSQQLRRLTSLGFNAVEFMPWTGWPGGRFNWGYEPSLLFAAEHRYVNDPDASTVKLDALRNLVNRCHDEGLHVILDLVLNHASESRKGLGFPYYWLYRHAENCPFIGRFQGGGYFQDLDYENACCQAFVTDVCRYWMKEFGIDGLRLDYTLGFYDAERSDVGLAGLVQEIRAIDPDPNFYLAIEHLSDNRYDAIGVCNRVKATSNWFDSLHYACRDGLLRKRSVNHRNAPVDKELVRIANSCMDYDAGRWPTLYLSNHDHSAPASYGEGQDKWFRLQPWTILLYTLPGALLLYNGQEFADDAYVPDDGPDRVSARPLRWKEKLDRSANGKQMERLCRGLAQIRSKNPALRSRNVYPKLDQYDQKGNDWLDHPNKAGYGLSRPDGLLIFHRWSDAPGDRSFIVVLNFSDNDWSGWVPLSKDGRWTRLTLFDGDGETGEDVIATGGGAQLSVGSNWGHVLRST